MTSYNPQDLHLAGSTLPHHPNAMRLTACGIGVTEGLTHDVAAVTCERCKATFYFRNRSAMIAERASTTIPLAVGITPRQLMMLIEAVEVYQVVNDYEGGDISLPEALDPWWSLRDGGELADLMSRLTKWRYDRPPWVING